jgi:Zn-dependent protease/CBS domain-containing protein
MTSSVELFRIAGIRIGINWSWLVVFALITWSLASAVFPAENPGHSDAAYLVAAVVAALLFFVTLLLHELGHAFQARREGMEIDGITLWLFGGVAKFKGTFPSAGAEFRIAIAGPLVSLVLGLLFVGVAVFMALPDILDGVAAWLGYINLFLLAFNLLPALPLDGGRVLRSILWGARGDFAWATRIAAGIGRGFGFLLIAGGFALAVFESSFSGLWVAFTGWFLLAAAGAEARYLATREALSGRRVGDLMVRRPATVPPDMTLGEFMDHIVWQRRHTTYPVVEDGVVVGLLPFRCVAEVPRSQWETRTVRDCMLPRERVPTLDEDEDLSDALVDLTQGDVQRGVVVEDGRLVGFLSITDLARALETAPKRR